MKTEIYKFPMNGPEDLSGLRSLVEDGTVIPNEIVAIIAKTEGNGNVNGHSSEDWCGCGYWDIGCKINCFGKEQGGKIMGGMGIGLVAVGAIAYLILRRKTS